MIWIHYHEPTLDEMLSDSIIQAVMQADHVDPRTVRRTMRQATKARLTQPPRPPVARTEPAHVA
jgi:hypothetical protein